jgi:hypothetical protein
MSGDCQSGGRVESSAEDALFMLIADRDRGNNTFVTITPADDDPAWHWYADGQIVRAAHALRHDDDDWGPGRILVREVLDDVARQRLVGNIAVDKELGDQVEAQTSPNCVPCWPPRRTHDRGAPCAGTGPGRRRRPPR